MPLYLAGTGGEFKKVLFQVTQAGDSFGIVLARIFFYIWACVFIYIISYVCFLFFIIYICVGSNTGIILGSSSSSGGCCCCSISRVVVVALYICRHVYPTCCPRYELLHVMSFLYDLLVVV